jgi:hypothetical protein
MSLRNVVKSTFALPIVWRYRGNNRVVEKTGKVVQFELSHFVYARYFYNLIQFFRIENWEVWLDAKLSVVHSLNRAQHAGDIFEEKLIKLGRVRHSDLLISTSQQQGGKKLNAWDFEINPSPGSVIVPMAQHPNMYRYGWWNEPVKKRPMNAAIFVGNCDDKSYQQIERDNLFSVINRVELINSLKKIKETREVVRITDLENPVQNTINLVETKLLYIPPQRFRAIIANYRFFICAPGVFMPLCHNLIEALSVGVIPIIQKSYAKLMTPGLQDGKNALIFSCRSEFEVCWRRIFTYSEPELQKMSEEAMKYYNTFLTPSSVVSSISSSETSEIFLLAGQKSVDLRRAQMITKPTR